MSIKFLVLGGGIFRFFLGGGAPILFLWARGFSDNWVGPWALVDVTLS